MEELFRESFPAPVPAAADVDRVRLRRQWRGARVVPYVHRAFDTRWMCGNGASPEICLALGADILFVTRRLAASTDAPLRLVPLTSANLTMEAAAYVRRMNVGDSDLFHHVVACLAARAPLSLPSDAHALRESALLGYRFASLIAEDSLLLPMSAAEQALQTFGVPARIGKEARMLRGSVLRVDDGERAIERIYNGDELRALADLGGDATLSILGHRTFDVHLNERALWRNVPAKVWSYAHAGVPLLRAWLRDRRASALGRALTREEVAHFSGAVRRIVALLLLQPALERSAAA